MYGFLPVCSLKQVSLDRKELKRHLYLIFEGNWRIFVFQRSLVVPFSQNYFMRKKIWTSVLCTCWWFKSVKGFLILIKWLIKYCLHMDEIKNDTKLLFYASIFLIRSRRIPFYSFWSTISFIIKNNFFPQQVMLKRTDYSNLYAVLYNIMFGMFFI